MALFDTLKSFFAQEDTTAPAPSEDPLTQRVVLLLETAGADFRAAPEEAAAIEKLLITRYDLSAEETGELIALARKRLEDMGDIYTVTRALTKVMSPEERLELMTEIWEIIFADGRLDAEEEHFARKMGKLLHLDHPTWISAKLAARERRAGSDS